MCIFFGGGGPHQPSTKWKAAHYPLWGEHLTWHAHGTGLFGDIYWKDMVLSFGVVLSRWAALWMYLLRTVRGHNGTMAISKIMKWVYCATDCTIFVGTRGVYTIFVVQVFTLLRSHFRRG